MEIIIKIQIDGIEEKDITVTTETKKHTEKMDLNPYARFFDDGCVGWTKDSEYNLAFLRQQENYADDMLKSRGHLFLNEVYDMLGIPRTKAGAVMGWIYDEEHPYGGNFVSFDIYGMENCDSINGNKSTFLLDFNVDGNILDLI